MRRLPTSGCGAGQQDLCSAAPRADDRKSETILIWLALIRGGVRNQRTGQRLRVYGAPAGRSGTMSKSGSWVICVDRASFTSPLVLRFRTFRPLSHSSRYANSRHQRHWSCTDQIRVCSQTLKSAKAVVVARLQRHHPHPEHCLVADIDIVLARERQLAVIANTEYRQARGYWLYRIAIPHIHRQIVLRHQ